MKVKFITDDHRREAEYICFNAKSITEGHYQKGGFYVLPYPEKLNSKAVYFPDLGYSKEFWKAIKDCKNMDLGKPFPESAVREVELKTKEIKNLKTYNIINTWLAKEKNFFETLQEVAGFDVNSLDSIEVMLTPYGTLGSFNFTGNKFIATHRIDMNVDDIGRKIIYMVIIAQTKKHAEIGEKNWYERKTIVEYLLNNTRIKQVIPNTNGFGPHKNEQKLLSDSQNYLAKLGFGGSISPIKVSGWGKITIADVDIAKIFTQNEEYVFKLLVKNKGNIVEFDEFTKIPSLYALSKTVENIRKKIRNLDINQDLIHTKRGKGYFIYR